MFFDSVEGWEKTIKETPTETYINVFKEIKEAFDNGEDKAIVFEIFIKDHEDMYEVSLDKDQWIQTLSSCIDAFSENDLSDYAIDAYTLKKAIEEKVGQ